MASGFICYDSYLRKTRSLSDEALGKLFRALMSYHLNGLIPEMEDAVCVAFDFIREDLDDGDEKYLARCETNRQNRLSSKKPRPEESARPGEAEEDPSIDDREPSSTIVNDRDQKEKKNKKKNENQKYKGVPPVAPPRGRGLTPLDGFDEFYASFPLHVSKQAAVRAWNSLHPDDTLRRVILAALEKQKQSDQWRRDGGRFIPHPSTWLNGRRWEDELQQAAPIQEPRWNSFPSHQYSQRDYHGLEESMDDVLDRLGDP